MSLELVEIGGTNDGKGPQKEGLAGSEARCVVSAFS